MRILRKINKGLILAIIVVIAVTIYSINLEAKRSKEKENIKLASESFIDLTSNYITLPEKYQKIGTNITDEEWNAYLKEVKSGLKEKMIDNEAAVDIQTNLIESELYNQVASGNIITKFKRNILKINSYSFDGDQVTVTLQGIVDKDTKYLTVTGYDDNGNETSKEEVKTDSFETSYETITLQKINDSWKVVYADLMYSGFQAI